MTNKNNRKHDGNDVIGNITHFQPYDKENDQFMNFFVEFPLPAEAQKEVFRVDKNKFLYRGNFPVNDLKLREMKYEN